MRMYLIAKIRGGNNNRPIKFRIINLDNERIKDVSKEELIEDIKKNPWAFENVAVEADKILQQTTGIELYEITAKEGSEEIPLLNIAGGNLSRIEYIIISIDEAKNSIKLIRYDGDISEHDLRKVHSHATEIANLPEKYKQRNWKMEPIPTEDEKNLTALADELYEKFILKTRALGLDCTFTYKVNRTDIILTLYTGTSTHAIVPKFITVIGNGAFHKKGLLNL